MATETVTFDFTIDIPILIYSNIDISNIDIPYLYLWKEKSYWSNGQKHEPKSQGQKGS